MNKIHPLATVHPDAKIGDNVEIGPYAYIDEFVEIGDGCHIFPHGDHICRDRRQCEYP